MREALAHTGDASRLRRNAAAAAAAAAALGLPPSCKGGWHCCEGGSWDAARLIDAGVARGRGEQGLDWDVNGNFNEYNFGAARRLPVAAAPC